LIYLSVVLVSKPNFSTVLSRPFGFTRSEYPAIASKALSILLLFSTSYLCEAAFSTMKIMKMKCRTTLQSLGYELRVSLPTIRPEIEKLCAEHQA
jgi:hypothetical protein